MGNNGHDQEGRTAGPKGLRVSEDSQTAQGKYSNFAMFRHTKEEFFLDFILNIHGEAQLVSRVLASPKHAKEILQALKENIDRYEKRFGTISK